jgi:ATP-dependent DNA helicase RecQ
MTILQNTDVQKIKEVFGIDDIKAYQEESLESVLCGFDTFVLAGAGQGKSLIYQAPAVLGKKVMVVSPLIALMQDQVTKLGERGIKSLALHSQVENRTLNEDRFAKGDFAICYVSPETLSVERIQRLMPKIDVLAIDEAHCVSEWGHDFRPEYMTIGKIKQNSPNLRDSVTIALTATAPKRVREDVIGLVQLDNPTFVRGELWYENLEFFKQAPSVVDDRYVQIRQILGQYESTNPRYPALIYANKVRELGLVKINISELVGGKIGSYHGQQKSEDRETNMRAFFTGEHKLLVATKAFGMGVHTSDIRTVIMYGLPSSLEDLYQRAGRAGRDGDTSQIHILEGKGDYAFMEKLNKVGYPSPTDLTRLHKFFIKYENEGIAQAKLLYAKGSRDPGMQFIAEKQFSATEALFLELGIMSTEGGLIRILEKEPDFAKLASHVQIRKDADAYRIGKVREFMGTQLSAKDFLMDYFLG